jgi:DNA-binding transcriptional ArsR family regulator
MDDGQTLSALEERLPMTRFGVMKHLKLLEEAGLIATRRRGREKLHFLNPIPIRLVHDRWVSKYAAPWAAALSDLKQELEDRKMEKIFEIYIKTTPERLWQAITDTEMRRKYNSARSSLLTGRRAPDTGASAGRRRFSKARTSRSIRRADSSRAFALYGART